MENTHNFNNNRNDSEPKQHKSTPTRRCLGCTRWPIHDRMEERRGGTTPKHGPKQAPKSVETKRRWFECVIVSHRIVMCVVGFIARWLHKHHVLSSSSCFHLPDFYAHSIYSDHCALLFGYCVCLGPINVFNQMSTWFELLFAGCGRNASMLCVIVITIYCSAQWHWTERGWLFSLWCHLFFFACCDVSPCVPWI